MLILMKHIGVVKRLYIEAPAAPDAWHGQAAGCVPPGGKGHTRHANLLLKSFSAVWTAVLFVPFVTIRAKRTQFPPGPRRAREGIVRNEPNLGRDAAWGRGTGRPIAQNKANLAGP
jgi:hypothetical protein